MSKKYKFRGGFWIGSYANSWPSGVFEVRQDGLVLYDKMMRKEYRFDRTDVEKLEVVKFIPIIGNGIQIYHHKKGYNNKIIFWYLSFKMKNLIAGLKEFNWL